MAIRALIRSLTVALGLGSIAWGVLTLPQFWREAALERTASKIIAGVPFEETSLAALLTEVKPDLQAETCRPAGARSAALVQLRLFEGAYAAGDAAKTDVQADALDGSVRRALACEPADPFLWQVLFSLESLRNGFRPAYFDYLRMSYRLGPNEAWVALKRNPVLLSIFGQLPPDLAESALNEFARIVDNGLFSEAAAILTGAGWNVREDLLRRLETVPLVRREAFAKQLFALGYDLPVPGVAPVERRYWR